MDRRELRDLQGALADRSLLERGGFTLVELLLAIAIVGLLLALLMPAVQWSRESSRRAACGSNMRQIGLALSNYESTHASFPAGSCVGMSFHVNLLPYLERGDLYERVQFAPDGAAFLENVPLRVLICPSDGTPAVLPNEASGVAGTNYAGCSGVWGFENGFDGVLRYCEDMGLPFKVGFVRPSDILDGTSQTIAVSEILRANGDPPQRLRAFWNTPHYFVPGQIDALAAECGSIPENAPAYGWRGDGWTLGTPWPRAGLSHTLYAHVLTPNGPSCANRSGVPNAATTAASAHPGGVQSLFADGHLEYVSESITSAVWRERATRAGARSP